MRHSILLVLALCAGSLLGQINTDTCYICLTRNEALQAADSALTGQSSARRLAITHALYVLQGRDVSDLKKISTAQGVQVDALQKSLSISQGMNAAAAKELRRSKGKATRKAIGWILGAGAVGYILGNAGQ